MNTRQKVVVVIMDILILAEMFYSISLGQGNPETLSGTFIRAYVLMLLITVFAGRYLIRRLETPEAVPAE